MLAIKTHGPTDVITVFAPLNEEDIDDLAFGAIKLDAEGTVLSYNTAESEITGRKAADVIGKNFFTDVAPCTKTPTFQGRFMAGVKSGNLNLVFDYVFDNKMRPTEVRVQMRKAAVGDAYWIFVKRLAPRTGPN